MSTPDIGLASRSVVALPMIDHFAHQGLAVAVAVDVSGVEEGNAGVECGTECRTGDVVIGIAVGVAKRVPADGPSAEADFRDG